MPSRAVSEFYTDVLVELCVAFMEEALSVEWVQQSLVQVPITVFTEENKRKLVSTLSPEN